MNDFRAFFLNPTNSDQRQYEALRSFYVDNVKAQVVAEQFGFSPSYFKKLRFQFSQSLKSSVFHDNPFFVSKKPGPKTRRITDTLQEEIITLRKKNYSSLDIKAALNAKEVFVSLDTICSILAEAGFAKLPRRTRFERISLEYPPTVTPPITRKWKRSK